MVVDSSAIMVYIFYLHEDESLVKLCAASICVVLAGGGDREV